MKELYSYKIVARHGVSNAEIPMYLVARDIPEACEMAKLFFHSRHNWEEKDCLIIQVQCKGQVWVKDVGHE